MTDNRIIESSVSRTMQDDKYVSPDLSSSTGGGLGMLFMLGANATVVPPWWSRRRDVYLRDMVHRSDHLAGALYNLSVKLRTIPLNIHAKNESITWHTKLAKEYEHSIINLSEFGQGFDVTFSKWIDDYHSQDNGAFLEIIADGPRDGPIRGRIISIAHIDSACCTRTSNPIYPVIYSDPNTGKKSKLHYTRVVATSQRPSPIKGMNNVGFCSVSSILSAAQNLIDIQLYKQERVGSRPAEAFIITGGGLDPEDVKMAMAIQESIDDNASLTKYSRAVIAGSRNIQDPKFEIHRLTELPEWFDERESTVLSMAIIAMGFGMDARELFPTIEAGASKAEAIISHIKQRGRGPGHILKTMEHILNTWVLPPFLAADFDYQDDTEDRASAEIRNVRAQARERDMSNLITNARVERQKMLHDGTITHSMFEDLELADGRLPDGIDVIQLFNSTDKDYSGWLGSVNDSNWEDAEKIISTYLINSRDEAKIIKARRALAAIKFKYHPEPTEREVGKSPKIDDSYQDERFGRKLPTSTFIPADETQRYQEDNFDE